MKKRIILFLMLSIFLIGIVSAQVSYCCERMETGAWCQNAPEEECDAGYLSAPTSCDATSYCQLGVCIDNINGNCMPNTPQRVCNDFDGKWDARDKADIPQCQLGCCLIGEQAAFTTLTRCKSLSSFYGLEIDYRTDVQSEIQCISLSGAKTKGACVFEEEFQRNCKMMTRTECQELQVGDASVDFYDGYLCSAESLETICGPRGGTTCVEGRDEVYFLDTCGNLANVYDYNRINDALYWDKITESTCTLDLEANAANANSPERCGNCDYYLGSTCKSAERGNNPAYGNNICEDLSCEYEGQNYEHGETWCATVEGLGGGQPNVITDENWNQADYDLPGSRDFRMVCYNGEVSVEPCADYRQEVCIQSEVNEFSTAACRVNIWQDCYSQTNQQDCENTDKRDCQWIEGVSVLRDEEGNSLSLDDDGETIEASCVPLTAPGFNFWEEGTDAGGVCSLASTVCYVEYVGKLVGKGADIGSLAGQTKIALDAKCMERCRSECPLDDPLNICARSCEEYCDENYPACVDNEGKIKQSWLDNMNAVCRYIGDCGSDVNYVGQEGYYEENDFVVKSSEVEEE